MKNYYTTEITELFSVSKIATIFYEDLPISYPFTYDKHDFWELLYIDRGESLAQLGDKSYYLSTGQALFYDPNTEHFEKPLNMESIGVGVISFVCTSPAMNYFKQNPKYQLNLYETQLFSSILSEGYNAFVSIKNDKNYIGMRARDDIPPTSLQVIKIRLEQLLLSLYCRGNNIKQIQNRTLQMDNVNSENEVIFNILEYLKEHVNDKITIDQISKEFNHSPSFLKATFKNQMGCGIIEFFSNMKIERAKILIRNSSLNFSQIANDLGFSDVHYFSKVFKQKTNMTPSEYSHSVKP